ncbi:NAD(P)/FAD-dependent oxidoreductase [bacterium]|nr:NAD(P)/FAD-dependent oxidoreductase [bacterium]MBU1994753.1 NAD(P)/FAD-dependent oxidoreductase [bacterium]
MSGCSKTEAKPTAAKTCSSNKNILGKHQIVVIGGGFGGLTVASHLKKNDSNFDVLVIEKNDTFMSCPVSNTYLGKLEGMNVGKFIFDYAKPVEKYGYSMLKAEVTNIDREAKEIHTALGIVQYEILILSPGIAYDYEGQFPTWSKEKISHISRVAPGALIPGSEHIILERNLKNMEDGDVIITVPAGKFRCPPAPFERACMIASYMKKEDIAGKVIILNPTNNIAKGAAFKEAWSELYGNMIEHIDFATITDVDSSTKTVTYTQKVPTGEKDKDTGSDIMKDVNKSHKYQVLNLIANNKASPVVQMATLETTNDSFHKVKMNGCSFQTATDKDVYAIGDVVGHGIPPSGQTANWAGIQCANEIAHRLHGKAYSLPVEKTPVSAGNVCYSMVGDKPEEAIMVTHDFSWTGTVITGKGNVPKAPDGKYRSQATAKALHDWYRGIMGDLFS